jgi:hypothetical protein
MRLSSVSELTLQDFLPDPFREPWKIPNLHGKLRQPNRIPDIPNDEDHR